MAFDACMMRAVLTEFRREFPEAKIEKVFQPVGDEIDLAIRYAKRSSRLVFNVGPNAPRLQLSERQKENPQKAPMLCMLLRKYFTGARIISAEQLGFDRIAEFTVSCYDEMGFKAEKRIICEIMGKYANLIVTDSERRILTAMKVIDFASSTVRQVLPGLKYQIPAKPDKLSPLELDRELFFSKLRDFPGERTGEKFITSTWSGIATQIARELVFRATGALDVPLMNIDPERFYKVFSEWQRLLIEERYTPTAVLDTDGKPVDYSYMDITYQPSEFKVVRFESFSELFDMYFAERDRHERIRQRARDVIKLLEGAEARTERKLGIQREALADAEKADEYKRKGDLITANIYRIRRGDERVRVVDYYDEACSEVEISLDPKLTAAQNAAKMYKLYNKCKTARRVLTEQIAIWEAELVYLESVRAFLDRAECEQDLIDIRDELYRSGYAARLRGYKPARDVKMRPIELKTSGGYTLIVGRNNTQNDHITFKLARKHDIWFHTKDIPGSHVIMQTNGEEPSERDYTEAAGIAAHYSKATGDVVAVDYTAVKNIKKPQGAKPGFVIYHTNYTAFVKPIAKIGETVDG